MALRAVITGDIVGSTALPKTDLRKLMRDFDGLLSVHQYEFLRGGSFQVYLKSPAEALSLVLKLRTAAARVNAVNAACDVKTAVGIGEGKTVKVLHTATDEAFALSGRAFDKLKAPQRLVFACAAENGLLSTALQITADYVDYIFRRLTAKQAAVLFELLHDRTQVEAAKRLKKKQSTINQHAQAAGWPELTKLITDYQQLLIAVLS